MKYNISKFTDLEIIQTTDFIYTFLIKMKWIKAYLTWFYRISNPASLSLAWITNKAETKYRISNPVSSWLVQFELQNIKIKSKLRESKIEASPYGYIWNSNFPVFFKKSGRRKGVRDWSGWQKYREHKGVRCKNSMGMPSSVLSIFCQQRTASSFPGSYSLPRDREVGRWWCTRDYQ